MGEAFGQSANPPQQNLGSEFGSIADQSGQILSTEQQAGNYDVNTLYPQMVAQEDAGTSEARSGTEHNIQKMAGGYQSAISALNPGWQSGLSALNTQASQAASGQPDALLGQMNTAATGATPNALTTNLANTANTQLGLGTGLSADQQMQAQQTALAGAQQQGRANDNSALASEVLNTDQYGQQLLGAREGAAAQADQSQMANTSQIEGFQGSIEGLNQAQQANNRGFLSTNEQIQQNALQPALGFFGANTQTPVSTTAPASIMSSAGGQVDPMLSYGSNMYDYNYNSQAATLLNNANNAAAIHGAIIGAVGNMAGGAMGCWVAREVLGRRNYRWAVFRQWLMDDSPTWFFKLNWAFGPAFADFIHDKPRIKSLIRPWMEKIVEAKWATVDRDDLAEIARVLCEYEGDIGQSMFTYALAFRKEGE